MKIFIVILALSSIAFAADGERKKRNLLNTFPFNQGDGHHDHGHHDHGHHDHGHHDHGHHNDQGHGNPSYDQSSQSSTTYGQAPNRIPSVTAPAPDSKQGQGNEIQLDIGTIAAAKERCVQKVVMVEETVYDDEVVCKHSYNKQCHTSYVTDYEPQQEEECDENFKKNCFIEYKQVASQEKVKFCHTPLVCQGEGPTECKTVYESHCETRYHVHDVLDDVVDCKTVYDEKCEDVTKGYTTEKKCDKWPRKECTTEKKNVKRYSPETQCKKVPKQLCGPVGCDLQPGPEECFDKDEAVIQEVPEETCHLEPQRECSHVTKLVPYLKPAQECVDVPKEVCSRSRTNPRKENKPVVKNWCYVPTKESGLIGFSGQ